MGRWGGAFGGLEGDRGARMTITRGLVALAVGLAGLGVMGADPAPGAGPQTPPMPVRPLSRDELAAKFLPTPRLFEMVVTEQTPPMSVTTQVCMGADTLRAGMNGGEARRRAAGAAGGAAADLSKGCRMSVSTTADGWTRMERVCEVAAGAARTSRMTNDFRGGMSEARTHLETQIEVDGATRTRVMDTHMTMLGECPADLKPGQARRPDGKIVDFPATASGAAGVKPPGP